MNFKNSFMNALIRSNEIIEAYIFKCANRVSAEHFTRECKMGFKEIIYFMLNMVKKSLQIELNNFFDKILKKGNSITKQAYSEARQKISPKAFIELNDAINDVIYKENTEYELWDGYRLSAIDGTTIELPNTEVLKKEFGVSKNQNAGVARASAGCIFDVINKIVIKSKINKCGYSERKMAEELILDMKKTSNQKELILFDRGYPSSEMISFLTENSIDFVIRVSTSMFKTKINQNMPDQIIEISYDEKKYKVRVLRFILSSGETEILLTSLLDEKYTIEDFKKLYFKRWGIEIKYDELKNRLEIENFTGTTKIAIEQDFYASIYLSNMAELARSQSDSNREQSSGKETKYQYKTNLNILIGSLKDNLVLMMLEKSKKKRQNMFEKIMEQISKSTVPIRPNRHNKRNKKLTRSKYKTNQKRCL